MAITKMGMLVVVVGLLAMVQQSVQMRYDTSSMLRETGNDLSPWAIVFSSKTCENTILESGDFVLNGTEVIAGRVIRKGSLDGHPVVLVNTGKYSANVASALQIVLFHYQIRGVLYLGLAGSLEDDTGRVAIGDVIIPESVAFTAIWDWLSLDANQKGDLVFGNFNQGGNQQNKLGSAKFNNVTLYTGQNKASSLFYLETDLPWMKKASDIEPLRFIVHFRLKGASSDMKIYNKAYASFLHTRFEFAAADIGSATVALVSKSNEMRHMVFHGVSYIAASGVPPNDEAKREAAKNAYLVLKIFLGLFPEQRGYITTYV